MDHARAPAGTALYVHLPYCAAKCSYCDFFSLPAAGQDLEGTLEALIAEARRNAPPAPRTVFLGGGTPSLYPAQSLRRLLDILDDTTGWRSSAVEVTAECNPESLDGAKAEALLDAGVTRLSIGFQSLDPARLALFGRVHSPAMSFAAFDAARSAGCAHINVDLIYAAPGQGLDEWRAELDTVLALEPDHLSAYNLTIEPGTAFARWHARGEVHGLDDELELAQFYAARQACRAAGLEPYEVSNYARQGEACRHNVGYWENREYVGIGPSAVSKVGARRFGNPRSIEPWRRRARAGEPAEEWSEELAGIARLGETWWLGLRLARGLSPAEAWERAGWQPTDAELDPALAVAREHVGHGLLAMDGDRYRLSERGLAVADGIGRRFIELGSRTGA